MARASAFCASRLLRTASGVPSWPPGPSAKLCIAALNCSVDDCGSESDAGADQPCKSSSSATKVVLREPGGSAQYCSGGWFCEQRSAAKGALQLLHHRGSRTAGAAAAAAPCDARAGLARGLTDEPRAPDRLTIGDIARFSCAAIVRCFQGEEAFAGDRDDRRLEPLPRELLRRGDSSGGGGTAGERGFVSLSIDGDMRALELCRFRLGVVAFGLGSPLAERVLSSFSAVSMAVL